MQGSVPVLIALLLAAVPTGLAGWASDGDFEPNTEYDTRSFMFNEPSTEGQKVYFNAFSTIQVVGPNPNVAALQTRNQVVPIETPGATLGIWTDCNGDGYIGMAEGALREYPVELLTLTAVDATVCPPAQGSQRYWDGHSHNYNGWVSELIPIGNAQTDLENNSRQIMDPLAMVWIDYGRPDDSSALGGGNCPINPQPRGTYQSTGGLLNFLNCSTGLLGAMNTPWQDEVVVAETPVPGPGDPAGLRFSDEDDARGHAVWDQQTFGSEDSQNAAVSVVDCSAEEPLFSVGDTFAVNETLNDAGLNAFPELGPAIDEIEVPALAPATGADPTSATVPGQVNQTSAELGDCDTTDDTEGPFYGPLEDDVAATEDGSEEVGKRSAADNFDFSSSSRGVVNPANPRWNGQAGALDEFGLFGVGALHGFSANWQGTNLITLPNTVTTRGSVSGGNVTPAIEGPRWLTYYAFVSSVVDDVAELPGGTGIYGSAQCGANEAGEHNGWDCDPATWNLNADGTPIDETAHPLVRVGQTYNLRDVDCLDGGNNLGVGVMPAFYGDENCS